MTNTETFSAIHIKSIELSDNVAKNCKLRSKFMHEKIIECKSISTGEPINIVISNQGMNILSLNNLLLETYSISQVSYSACDKSSHQFAIVSRQQLPPDNNIQMCHVFRFHSTNEAESVNRHFGGLFKQLQVEKRRQREERLARKSASSMVSNNSNSNNDIRKQDSIITNQNENNCVNVSAINNSQKSNTPSTSTMHSNLTSNRPETRSDLPRRRCNNPIRRTIYGEAVLEDPNIMDLEKKLRRISSPLIEELMNSNNSSNMESIQSGLIRSGSSSNAGNNGTRLRNNGGGNNNNDSSTRRLSLCVIPTSNSSNNGLQNNNNNGRYMIEDEDENEPVSNLMMGLSGAAGGGGGGGRKRRSGGSTSGSSNENSSSNKHSGATNRISAVFERFSLKNLSSGAGSGGANGGSGRASRDVSVDCLKSGSPVVLLKERIESGLMTPPETTRQQRSSLSDQNNQNQIQYARKSQDNPIVEGQPTNIAYQQYQPLQVPDVDEVAPVPPVRIHSLRQIPGAISSPIPNPNPHLIQQHQNSPHSFNHPQHPQPLQNDLDISPITTPSSSSDVDELEEQNRQIRNRNYKNNQDHSTPISHNNTHLPPPPYTPTPNMMDNIDFKFFYYPQMSKENAKEYLLTRDIGAFVLRDSASQPNCLALSVKVGPTNINHYIIARCPISTGYRIVGLDKSWPNLNNLITHLSVIPELLPCPLTLIIDPIHHQDPSLHNNNNHHHHQQQYQQLSEFSSIVASLDMH